MDAIQTITQDISKVVSANDIYLTYKPTWTYLLESYIGGEEYRRAQHLTRYQLESDGEYQARLRNTPLQNHCQSVISVYNSFLFREQPYRDYANIENLPELEDFLKDADFDGRSLNNFMKDVATYSSVFGHCWIIVAKPNVGASNRAEEQAQGVRPYLNLLTPLVVVDWNWRREPSGRYTLSYLKYIEDIQGDIVTVKEWREDVVTTTVVDSSDETELSREEVPNGLGKIPAVIAYNGRSVIRGIGVSDIGDIADSQRFIYNATSEVDESIRLDTHPSLVKTPETVAGTGAGSLIHMPENLDPGLKPYIIEYSGASVDSILKTITHQIDAIDKMANIGAVRATESRTMSGVAMETEFQLLNARLAEKADNLELAEEQMWKIWCDYQGVEWGGHIEYPGSFNIRDTQMEINQLRTAAETVKDNPKAMREVVERVMEWMGEEDWDEQEMEHPVTISGANRTEHIQQMIMEGYTDQQILALHPEINQGDIDTAKQDLLEE